MTAVAVGACGAKRGMFDEDPLCPTSSSKRLRLLISSPSLSPPAPHVLATELLPEKLAQLRTLFPEMDLHQLSRALEEGDSDTYAAIQRLEALRHGACKAEPSFAPQLPQDGTAAPVMVSGESQNPEWANAVVRMMSGASDLGDAHIRAGSLLSKFDEAVTSKVAGAKVEECTVLKNQVNTLTKENNILKRAVLQLNSRQQEHANGVELEVAQLRQTVVQYQEQLKNAEMSNYALTMHLRQAMDHSVLGGGGPNPDIF